MPVLSVRATIFGHVFELATAVVFALIGLAYLFNPEATALASPVGRDLGIWQHVWSIGEVIAAPIVISGITWAAPRWRATGLTLLGTCLIMHGIGAMYNGFEARDLVYFIFSAACFLRVGYFIRTYNGVHA